MYVHTYTACKVCNLMCLPNEVSGVYHYNDFYDHSRTGVSCTRNLSRRESRTGRWQVSVWVRPCHTQPSNSMTIVRFIWGSLSFGNMKCSVSWGRFERLPGHQTKAHLGTSERSCFPLLCLHVHGAVFSYCREPSLVDSGLPKALVLFP